MIDSALENLEVLDDSEVEDFDILLTGSDDEMEDDIDECEEIGGNRRRNKKNKKKADDCLQHSRPAS